MKWIRLLALVALGFGLFWFFGRERPIVLDQTSVASAQTVACPNCGGGGFIVPAPQACARCGGTGEADWKMKSSSKRTHTLSKSKPKCAACGGTGSVTSRTTCPRCGGTGRTPAAATQKVRSVRMGLSLWERFLATCGVAPDPNPAPPYDRQGGCPLVAAYLDAWSGPDTYRIVDWGGFQNVAGTWQATVVIETSRGGEGSRKKSLLFSVRDRAVVGCGAAP